MDFSFLGNVELDHLLQAMQDGRVRRALARALLDAKVRREYRELRVQGQLVREAVEMLAARHHCSEETILRSSMTSGSGRRAHSGGRLREERGKGREGRG